MVLAFIFGVALGFVLVVGFLAWLYFFSAWQVLCVWQTLVDWARMVAACKEVLQCLKDKSAGALRELSQECGMEPGRLLLPVVRGDMVNGRHTAKKAKPKSRRT